MAILQQLRWKCRMPEKQRFVQLFSSNSSNSNNNSNQESDLPSPKDLTANLEDRKSKSHFSDVKASLRQQPASPPPPRSTPPPSPREHFPPTFHAQRQPSQVASLEEIRKNLSEFRRRSAAPLRSSSEEKKPLSSSSTLSFQDVYNRSINSEQGENRNSAKLSFEAIRESLRHLTENENTNKFRGSDKGGQQVSSLLSLNTLKQSFKLQSSDPNAPPSHPFTRPPPGPLPPSMAEKSSSDSPALKTEFVKMYGYGELGEKLRKLRPTAKAKNWFSFAELNERLKKLREFEEKETESRIGGVSFKDLRESLVRLRMSSDASTKKSSMQRLALLGQLGGQVTPSYMLSPPKEQLIEKYFHPDNMSAAEKLKLELKRVREEFKMSESDCGSSRVQVAQLTTKIKHLSSALHKKDKHSQKGLQAMVQRRKKLLKYIRRTDWDSYCFVLSKLGLRDNPDHGGQSAGLKVGVGGMGIKKRKHRK